MSNLKQALIKFPELCGAQDADREGRIVELIWDDEQKGESSKFAKKDGERPEDRLAHVFKWAHFCRDYNRAHYCKRLVLLCALRHREKEHGEIAYRYYANEIYTELKVMEASQPEVSALWTVEQSNAGIWF